MEAAGAPGGRPTVQVDLRRLRALLEARQRHLQARIAACEELTAEMAALRATLGAGEAGSAPRPGRPRPAGSSSVPGGEGDAEP